MGQGGDPLINMGLLKVFSRSFWRRIDPHSGSVYPHSDCLCYEGVEEETPDNHGDLNVLSTTHLVVTREKTHTVVPYSHIVVVCVLKRVGGNPW